MHCQICRNSQIFVYFAVAKKLLKINFREIFILTIWGVDYNFFYSSSKNDGVMDQTYSKSRISYIFMGRIKTDINLI